MLVVILLSLVFYDCVRAETIVKDEPANFSAIATDQFGNKVPVSGEMETIQIMDVHKQSDNTYDPGLSIDINVRPLNSNEQWQSTTPGGSYQLPGPSQVPPATWFNGVPPHPTSTPFPTTPFSTTPFSPSPPPTTQSPTPQPTTQFTNITDIQTIPNPDNSNAAANYPYTAGSVNTPTTPAPGFGPPFSGGQYTTTLSPSGFPTMQSTSTTSAPAFGPPGFPAMQSTSTTSPPTFSPPGFPGAPVATSTSTSTAAPTGYSDISSSTTTPAPGFLPGFPSFTPSASTSTPMPFNPFYPPQNTVNTGLNTTQQTSTPFPWLTPQSNGNTGFNFNNMFGRTPTTRTGYNMFGDRTGGRTSGPNPGESYFESGFLNNDTDYKNAGKTKHTNATLTDLLMDWFLNNGENVDDYTAGDVDYDYETVPMNGTENAKPYTKEDSIDPNIYEAYFKPSKWNKFTNVTYDNSDRSGASNPSAAFQPQNAMPSNSWSPVANPWFKMTDMKKLPTADFASLTFSQVGRNQPQWTFNVSGPDVVEYFKNTTNFDVSTMLQNLNMTFKDPMAWPADLSGASTINVAEQPNMFEIDNYGKPINISEIMISVEQALRNLTTTGKNDSSFYGHPADVVSMFQSVDVNRLTPLWNGTSKFDPSDLANGMNQITRDGFNTLSNYSASFGNLKKNVSGMLEDASKSSMQTNAAASASATTSGSSMDSMADMNMGHDNQTQESSPSESNGEASNNAAAGSVPSWTVLGFALVALLSRSLSA